MRIHNLYADGTGETHFRDVEIEWDSTDPFSSMTRLVPAKAILFRKTDGSYFMDWHPAPCRQYIVNLDGAVKITASDGEARIIGTGEILLVEDTTGKGHRAEAVDGKPRNSLQIRFD